VLGEGAGVVVLTTLEKAEEMGLPILGEYVGGSMSCDAHHITEPRSDGKGIALCINNALKNAGVDASEIDYINAHATSTPVGDMAEIEAIRQVIPEPSKVTINGTKSMIGHGLGAAAGLEAVATIEAIRTGWAHGTINLDNPEKGILEFDVPKVAVQRDIKLAMSTSFGFGGHNAVLLFKRFE
jgi:3-oxoacyl-[acyl-carrier-protein] synthase II